MGRNVKKRGPDGTPRAARFFSPVFRSLLCRSTVRSFCARGGIVLVGKNGMHLSCSQTAVLSLIRALALSPKHRISPVSRRVLPRREVLIRFAIVIRTGQHLGDSSRIFSTNGGVTDMLGFNLTARGQANSRRTCPAKYSDPQIRTRAVGAVLAICSNAVSTVSAVFELAVGASAMSNSVFVASESSSGAPSGIASKIRSIAALTSSNCLFLL